MKKNVTQYDLLISCPGDITTELDVIRDVVENFNSSFGDVLNITLRTKHWTKNSYAQSGGKPQDLLNEQFVKDCDAAIAIFWTRFGTPTDKYGSGTEEEIQIMLDANKQVFLYFSDKPLPPSQTDTQGLERVKAFRNSYRDKGIYSSYSSDEEFEKLLFAHLSKYFLTTQSIAEITNDRKPKLLLKGIDSSNALTDNAIFQQFNCGADDKISVLMAEIKQTFQNIARIHLSSVANNFVVFDSPVKLNEDWISIITLMAERLDFDLPEDFFNIGNLATPLGISSVPFSGPNFKGSDEEKKKYHLLEALYLNILDLIKWLDIQTCFTDIMCVKLALTNSGTSIDEDIVVTLEIPVNSYKTLDELPALNDDTMHYLSYDCDMTELFGIPANALYNDYHSALKEKPYYPQPVSTSHLLYGPGDAEVYRDDLEDVFCYEIFQNGENYIIKLKFDYIKHHTTVAFPAPFLLNEKISTIKYTITSQNSVDVISGNITIE